jgi:hypothetical protein
VRGVAEDEAGRSRQVPVLGQRVDHDAVLPDARGELDVVAVLVLLGQFTVADHLGADAEFIPPPLFDQQRAAHGRARSLLPVPERLGRGQHQRLQNLGRPHERVGALKHLANSATSS